MLQGRRTFLGSHGAKQLHPVAIIVRLVFGALPDSFSQNLVEVGGEVTRIPEYVSLWVLTDGAGGVSLEAVLTRGNSVSAEGAILLAPGGTRGLELYRRNHKNENKKGAKTEKKETRPAEKRQARLACCCAE